jgi:hypothetical protein
MDQEVKSLREFREYLAHEAARTYNWLFGHPLCTTGEKEFRIASRILEEFDNKFPETTADRYKA